MRHISRSGPPVAPVAMSGGLWLIACLAAPVVVVLGFLYAGDGQPGAVDERIRPAGGGVGGPWRDVALAADFWGEPGGAAALVAVLMTGCVLLRRTRAAVLAVAGAGLTVGVTKLLKHLVGRTINGGYLSYPSGHTAFVTALALVAAIVVAGRLRLGGAAGTSLVLTAALAAGAVMGWAQVALGAHYATDAVGGWCTALAVVPATAWLVDRTADRLARRRPAGAPLTENPDR